MKWLQALFGQARVPRSHLERVFAMTTGAVTLETSLQLRPSGRAGLVFRPVESSFFETANRELEQLLHVAERESGTVARRQRDSFGYEWLILEDEHFEDLVAAAHLAGQTFQHHGFADRLLAAVFGFQGRDGQRVYWIYNYKRANFYPFVPGSGRSRDNPFELRLAAIMDRELDIERDRERWYPLWDAPL